MKQALIKRGTVNVEDVPAPILEDNSVLVEVGYSLISVGTELSSLQSSGKSLINMALQEPEKVKKVFNYLKKKGIRKTMDTVQQKIGGGTPVGYSCSGVVIQIGKNITYLKPGDRVACAGAGKANHAEIVLVPKNLVVKIPDNCDLKEAASVTLGSIAMQGVRRADVHLGEKIAVIGLGLVGQITNQLLKTAGCRTIGLDLHANRVKLAEELGLDKGLVVREANVKNEVMNYTEGHGSDATIITAASKSDEIVQQAMEITRKKGKVVVVGDVGLGLERQPFYQKEIDFLISCAYGPGRYEGRYEEKGLDYPYAYIRWTENRNMREYLKLLAENKLDFMALVDKVYGIQDTPKAYEELQKEKDRPLSILLDYNLDLSENQQKKMKTRVKLAAPKISTKNDILNVAVIGAGSFAKSVHLPNLKKLSDLYSIHAIVSKTGSNAKQTADKFGASYCSTDYREVLEDDDIDVAFITTRHNLHAKMTIEALKAGKHVFVEKPLCLNQSELEQIVKVYNSANSRNSMNPKNSTNPMNLGLMVGFNRRFSPAARKAKKIINNRENPMIVNYRVNAGYIPLDHWVHTEEGGGRIIGEACHMFDLFNYFVDSEVESVDVSALSPITEHISALDNIVATLKYIDGSICSLTYAAIGSSDAGKEYIEVYFDNKTMIIDDFKKLKIYGVNKKGWSDSQDKGHLKELECFAAYLNKEAELPLSLEEMVSATEISITVDKMASGAFQGQEFDQEDE